MGKLKMILVGTAYPYRGGLAVFNERLARSFQEAGYEVELWTFTVQYPNFLFPGKTQYSADPAPKDLTIHRKLNSLNPFNWLKVGRQLRKANADLVVFAYWMSFFAPCYGVVARRLRNVKRIALVHNMMPHEKTILDKLLPPFFVKSMDGFVALSEAVLDDVAKLDKCQKPKAWWPHPIYDHYGPREPRETALERLGLSKDFRYMLFFGLVRAYKGLDLLIDAFADGRLAKLPLRLMVAGEFYEGKEDYLQAIKSHGLEDKVVIRDEFVPDSEVKNYFNAADIVVQPYKSATQSGVTQIAYHFETPMLVTDVGGLKEIVPNGKVGYVTDVDPQQIASALVDFFENQRHDAFVQHIQVEKQKYSWSRMVDTVVSVSK